MKSIIHKSLIAAAILGAFSLFGTGLVTIAFKNTEQQISKNEEESLLTSLKVLVPKSEYDNDISEDTFFAVDSRLDGKFKPVKIYRARKEGKPVAVVIESIAEEGYNGRLKLIVAIRESGELAGVRVVSHRETPGLGDAVELTHSNWILSFDGKSLLNPFQQNWAVERDGGKFDQFTGATITPRAVIKAVKNTLLFYQSQKNQIFDTPEGN